MMYQNCAQIWPKGLCSGMSITYFNIDYNDALACKLIEMVMCFAKIVVAKVFI